MGAAALLPRPRQLEAHEIAERIARSETQALLKYLQQLRRVKACLESVALLAKAELVGVSEQYSLGRSDVDGLPDCIDAIIHDCGLAGEIERIDAALSIKGVW